VATAQLLLVEQRVPQAKMQVLLTVELIVAVLVDGTLV
jgi:hypothetical protein